MTSDEAARRHGQAALLALAAASFSVGMGEFVIVGLLRDRRSRRTAFGRLRSGGADKKREECERDQGPHSWVHQSGG